MSEIIFLFVFFYLKYNFSRPTTATANNGRAAVSICQKQIRYTAYLSNTGKREWIEGSIKEWKFFILYVAEG